MKKIMLVALLALGASSVFAQKFFTKNGSISFHSKATVENIEAANNKVTAVVDAETGKIEFAVLMKAFQFEKALMQEHFNENYVESDKFPKAKFSGQLADASTIKWKKDGEYEVKCTGKLTIHGETNEVSAPFKVKVEKGVITGVSAFTIQLSDYKIEIPKVVTDNINNSIEIKVNTVLKPLAK